jgi:hypothetical protein
MALEIPVSSSRLRKTNPYAVPGRWRAITHPATCAYWPSGMSLETSPRMSRPFLNPTAIPMANTFLPPAQLTDFGAKPALYQTWDQKMADMFNGAKFDQAGKDVRPAFYNPLDPPTGAEAAPSPSVPIG